MILNRAWRTLKLVFLISALTILPPFTAGCVAPGPCNAEHEKETTHSGHLAHMWGLKPSRDTSSYPYNFSVSFAAQCLAGICEAGVLWDQRRR